MSVRSWSYPVVLSLVAVFGALVAPQAQAAGDAARGKGSRDLMQIAAMLERFTSRKEMPPVVVTACGAPSEPHPEPGAGFWRRPWGPESIPASKQWCGIGCATMPDLASRTAACLPPMEPQSWLLNELFAFDAKFAYPFLR